MESPRCTFYIIVIISFSVLFRWTISVTQTTAEFWTRTEKLSIWPPLQVTELYTLLTVKRQLWSRVIQFSAEEIFAAAEAKINRYLILTPSQPWSHIRVSWRKDCTYRQLIFQSWWKILLDKPCGSFDVSQAFVGLCSAALVAAVALPR